MKFKRLTIPVIAIHRYRVLARDEKFSGVAQAYIFQILFLKPNCRFSNIGYTLFVCINTMLQEHSAHFAQNLGTNLKHCQS